MKPRHHWFSAVGCTQESSRNFCCLDPTSEQVNQNLWRRAPHSSPVSPNWSSGLQGPASVTWPLALPLYLIPLCSTGAIIQPHWPPFSPLNTAILSLPRGLYTSASSACNVLQILVWLVLSHDLGIHWNVAYSEGLSLPTQSKGPPL